MRIYSQTVPARFSPKILNLAEITKREVASTWGSYASQTPSTRTWLALISIDPVSLEWCVQF